MRQLVVVKTIAPARKFQFRIISIHEVNKQLIVVSELIVRDKIYFEALDYPLCAQYVDTSAEHQLDVVHYLLDRQARDEKDHNAHFGRHYFDDVTLTKFKPITTLDHMTESLQSGSLLYQCRTDGLVGLRLIPPDHDKFILPPPVFKNYGYMGCSSPLNHDYPYKKTWHPLDNILNIYLARHHGVSQIIFESIQAQTQNVQSLDLISKFSRACDQLNVDFGALKDSLLMMIDDEFSFEAVVLGNKVVMRTNAMALSLPTETEDLTMFMRVVRNVLLLLRPPSYMNEKNLCDAVQVSQQSVLACFEDFSASLGKVDFSYHYMVKQNVPLNLISFMNRPGTHHFLLDPAEFILQFILSTHKETLKDSDIEIAQSESEASAVQPSVAEKAQVKAEKVHHALVDTDLVESGLTQAAHAVFFSPAEKSPREILKPDADSDHQVAAIENVSRCPSLSRCVLQ